MRSLLTLLVALGVMAVSAAALTTSEAAALDVRERAAFAYDSPAAFMTSTPNTRTAATSGEHAAEGTSWSSTSLIAPNPATKDAGPTRWLRGTAGNAGPVPGSDAVTLRGRSFSSPKEFREAFWQAAADDAGLAAQFSASNVTRMGKGLAPRVVPSQRLGGQGSYILHHRTPVSRGGAPYDPGNILVVTPRYHKEVLNPGYHYGGGR